MKADIQPWINIHEKLEKLVYTVNCVYLQCMLWAEPLLCLLPSPPLSPNQDTEKWALPPFYLSRSVATVSVIDLVTPIVLIQSLSTACLQLFAQLPFQSKGTSRALCWTRATSKPQAQTGHLAKNIIVTHLTSSDFLN